MPTNALELLELSAVRRGLGEGLVEQRKPPGAPLDVLLQHLTGLACGPGFHPDKTYAAVRSCAAYADLNRDDWEWCLKFLEHGGEYPAPTRGIEPEDEESQRLPRQSRCTSPQAEHCPSQRHRDHGAICPWCRPRSSKPSSAS